ncbi:5'/3'-nucleotidase SurE [Kitasatospora sp. NPDC058444]|uniref:5'/3'-nucleotidase SurE n=1 Tax=Kitasatospora sp. NPDC058444 TaxID=3346504 RepID=UPI00364E3579
MRAPARRLVALTAAAAALAGPAGASAAERSSVASPAAEPGTAARPLAGLRVLLTNDDSMRAAKASNSDGLGLYELRRALCAAGADVVVMAPWQVRSGAGTAVSNDGVLTLSRRTDLPADHRGDCSGTPSGSPVYGVCLSAGPCGPDSPSATPADTVKLALRAALATKAGWTDGPDLVVTGINSGPNVSAQVNDSGTVGAALAAVEEGVPALAFSTAGDDSGEFFPLADYRAAADFGARLIAGLRARGLPGTEFALKVDYPDVTTAGPAKAARWTRVGHGREVWHAYRPTGADGFAITLGACEHRPGDSCTETVANADATALLRDGHISVTPVTPDRTYGVRTADAQELNRLRHYIEHDAPRP